MPSSLRPATHVTRAIEHTQAPDPATNASSEPTQGRVDQAPGGQSDARFALSSATAAGVAAACTYPLSAAVTRGIAHDMRLPTPADIALHGIPTTAARAMLQTGLIETIRPPVRDGALSALSQLPGARTLDAKQQRIAAELVALLGTSLVVSLITTPIENVAMMQNQSGKALLSVLSDVVQHKPSALFSSVSSTFISMNIAWAMRLYARLKAEGNPKKEEAISERLASINGPIKNFLRCVNSRQMVHQEALALAALGTLRTMASRPVNTIALIAMNIAIGAMMGTKIYHGVRDHMNERLHKSGSNTPTPPDTKAA